MNLVLDIGNTRLKMGLFDQEELVETRVTSDWQISELLAYGNRQGVQCAILSNVAAEDFALKQMLADNFHFLELNHNTPLPFENRYATPATLGKDRLAAVAGAHAFMPGKNCLVVDCGTCIKYDLLNADEQYLGGNIAPGARMRTQAMHTFTARLPEVPMVLPADLVGESTEAALQNGAFRGAALEIEGFVQAFEKRYTGLHVYLSGGDAAFFEPILNIPNLQIEPNLTLYGLNHILNYNREHR